MTDLRDAAQKALEALESTQLFAAHEHYPRRRVADALDALKAALEQHSKDVEWMKERHANWRLQKELAEDAWNSALKQKPVAIALHTGTKQGIKWFCRVDDGTPLYTHPPRREWRGLTEEEMHGLYRRAGLETYYPRDGVVQYEYERRLDEYARAIEAALKEKNHE